MEIARVDILDEDKLEGKHKVNPYKVEELLLSAPRIFFVEKDSAEGEDMSLGLGA